MPGDETSTKDENGNPHIFDWVVLREVEHYAETTTSAPQHYARIVMSDKAREEKIDRANLRTLKNLEQRQIVEVNYISRNEYDGGEYRQVEREWSDALLAIGGGYGTNKIGERMTDLGKPVIPLDLRIGSMSEDGNGALDLHKALMTEPMKFFPRTHKKVINRIGAFSLDGQDADAEAAAKAAAELIHRELDAAKTVNRLIYGLRNPKVLIPIILGAIGVTINWLGNGFMLVRLFEFVKDRFLSSAL